MSKAPNLTLRPLKIFSLFLHYLFEFWGLAISMRFMGPKAVVRMEEQMLLRQAERFRGQALEFGGLLIKLGQFLSARVDLLPAEYTEVLQSLQDQASRVPWPEIEPVLADLGALRERFVVIDQQPVAAASLAQVHRGILDDGRVVAVKVQRPFIRQVVEQDLRAVRWFLMLLERFTPLRNTMDLWAVYGEFEQTTRDELDYVKEAENGLAFRKNLSDVPYAYVPEVYPQLSAGRVLTMEFIQAVKITDHKALEQMGLSREVVARQLVQIYMKMVLEDGFFHADPHPGNLFVDADGRITLVDFGMVGRLKNWHKQELRKLFIAVSAHDTPGIVKSFDRLGFLRPTADPASVERAINLIIDQFYGSTLQELQQMDTVELAGQLQELMRSQPFQVPSNVAFLGRALSILVGVGTGLDPSLNIVGLFEPYARRLAGIESNEDVLRFLFGQAKRSGRALLELPELLLSHLREREGRDGSRLVRQLVRMQAQTGQRQVRAIYRVGVLLIGAVFYIHGEVWLAGAAGAVFLLSYLTAGRA